MGALEARRLAQEAEVRGDFIPEEDDECQTPRSSLKQNSISFTGSRQASRQNSPVKKRRGGCPPGSSLATPPHGLRGSPPGSPGKSRNRKYGRLGSPSKHGDGNMSPRSSRGGGLSLGTPRYRRDSQLGSERDSRGAGGSSRGSSAYLTDMGEYDDRPLTGTHCDFAATGLLGALQEENEMAFEEELEEDWNLGPEERIISEEHMALFEAVNTDNFQEEQQSAIGGGFTPSPYLPLYAFPPETPLHGVRGREGFYRALQRENGMEGARDAEARPGTVRSAFISNCKNNSTLPLPVLIRSKEDSEHGSIDCQCYGLGETLTQALCQVLEEGPLRVHVINIRGNGIGRGGFLRFCEALTGDEESREGQDITWKPKADSGGGGDNSGNVLRHLNLSENPIGGNIRAGKVTAHLSTKPEP